MKRLSYILIFLIITGLLLGACGPKDEKPVVKALGDLDGSKVTIAVENAYLPYNYIDPETGVRKRLGL